MSLADFNAISLIAFLAGLFLGNRLAIDRDKRREWNDLIEPVRVMLFTEREIISPMSERISGYMLFKIRERLPGRKRRPFDLAVQQYQESASENNIAQLSWGVMTYRDEQAVIHAIESLLSFLAPR